MQTPNAQPEDDLERTLELLVDLSRALHSVAVPTEMIEELVQGVSRRLGANTQLVVLQSAVIAQISAANRTRFELLRIPFDTSWRLQRLQRVVALARELAEGTVGVDAARAELARIEAQPNLYGFAAVLVGYSVYSAAVAARIGGRWLEMLAAAAVGVVAGVIHIGTIGHDTMNMQKSFLAGFFGTICVLALALALPSLGMAQALFGGVTLLVPAMVITIGMHELASGALEAGVPRTIYGLLRFGLIGAGIASAAHLWKLFAPIARSGAPHALPIGVVLVFVVMGGLALVVCLQLRWHDAPWVIGGVLTAFGAEALSKAVINGGGAPLAAAFLLGTVAYVQARFTRRSPAIVVIPGLLQIAPGFLGTKALLDLLTGTAQSHTTFFDVLLVALQLALGVLLAAVLFRPHETGERQQPRATHARRERAHARA